MKEDWYYREQLEKMDLSEVFKALHMVDLMSHNCDDPTYKRLASEIRLFKDE